MSTKKADQCRGINALGFSTAEWSEEDWADFYHSIERFRKRLNKRHRARITHTDSTASDLPASPAVRRPPKPT